MSDVAIYVEEPREEYGFSHPQGNYNVQQWFGVEMVRDVLQRAGIEVGYCSAATVARHRVVLVSITAARDWYRFVRERETWPSGGYKVIVGGFGVLNVRPFLDSFDIAWFGRAEDHIVALVRATLNGERWEHPSACYAEEFDCEKTYRIAQATRPYPHGYQTSRGKMWREPSTGCRRKCYFCAYTWHRRACGIRKGDGYYNTSTREATLFEFDFSAPPRVTAIDGFSERLRFAVNKPISREMLFETLRRLAAESPFRGRLKLFNIVGYPTEGEDDWREFIETLTEADVAARGAGKKWGLELHNTPLQPVPATPLACVPVAYENFKHRVARRLRRLAGARGGDSRYQFFEGSQFWAFETAGTESLASTFLNLLVLRGTEHDADTIRALARTRRFWKARVAERVKTLEKHLDPARFFGGYTWETLPTRYLRSYSPPEALKAAEAKFWRTLSHGVRSPKKGKEGA